MGDLKNKSRTVAGNPRDAACFFLRPLTLLLQSFIA